MPEKYWIILGRTVFENKFAIHSVDHYLFRIHLPFLIFSNTILMSKYRLLPLGNSLFLNRETCRDIIQFETYFKCFFVLVENVFISKQLFFFKFRNLNIYTTSYKLYFKNFFSDLKILCIFYQVKFSLLYDRNLLSLKLWIFNF